MEEGCVAERCERGSGDYFLESGAGWSDTWNFLIKRARKGFSLSCSAKQLRPGGKDWPAEAFLEAIAAGAGADKAVGRPE